MSHRCRTSGLTDSSSSNNNSRLASLITRKVVREVAPEWQGSRAKRTPHWPQPPKKSGCLPPMGAPSRQTPRTCLCPVSPPSPAKRTPRQAPTKPTLKRFGARCSSPKNRQSRNLRTFLTSSHPSNWSERAKINPRTSKLRRKLSQSRNSPKGGNSQSKRLRLRVVTNP